MPIRGILGLPEQNIDRKAHDAPRINRDSLCGEPVGIYDGSWAVANYTESVAGPIKMWIAGGGGCPQTYFPTLDRDGSGI